MSINSIGHNTASYVREAQQIRDALHERGSILSDKLLGIKNTASKINKTIKTYKQNIASNHSLLKSLRSVSAKHGENAPVRLKNGHFKSGQASNFFKNIVHGSRYQTEREAAVKKINAEGSTVSAGQAINTLQTRIGSALSKVNELKTEIDGHDNKINKLENKIYDIGEQTKELRGFLRTVSEADEKNRKPRENFSMVYQSNAGCKALNREARHQFGNAPSAGKVSGSKVVDEYRRVHGDEIFTRGNKELTWAIKAHCEDLSELVKTGAKAWYTPTETNITTFRGQGMKQSGINALISQFNADKQNKIETVYNLGQFFSTSTSVKVADEFASRSPDLVKVLFRVEGNSSNALSVPGGLSFNNNEGERLYSPLANFKVTAVGKVSSNTYHVVLEEVTKVNSSRILPY